MKAIFFIALAVAFFEIYRALSLLRKNIISLRTGFFWISLWVAIIIFALFPNVWVFLTDTVGMQVPVYFLFTIAILVIYVVIYDLTMVQKKNTEVLKKIVQEIAIVNYRLNKEKDVAGERDSEPKRQ